MDDKKEFLGGMGYGEGTLESPFGVNGGFPFDEFLSTVVMIAIKRAQSDLKDGELVKKSAADSSRVYINTIPGGFIPSGIAIYLENIGEVSKPHVIVGIEEKVNAKLDQMYPNIYDLLKELASLTKAIRKLKSQFEELAAIEEGQGVDIIINQTFLESLLANVSRGLWLHILSKETKKQGDSFVMGAIVELVCLSASEVTVKVGIDQYALFLTFVPSDDDTRDQLHFLLDHKNTGEEEVPIGDELLRRMEKMLGGYLLSSGLRGDVVVVKDKAKNEEVEL